MSLSKFLNKQFESRSLMIVYLKEIKMNEI